jgi:hypothetical protein
MTQQCSVVEKFFIVLMFACLPLNHALAFGVFANISMLATIVWFIIISTKIKYINIKLFVTTAWIPLVFLSTGVLSILLHITFGRDIVNKQLYLTMSTNLALIIYSFAIINIIRIENIGFILKCVKVGLVAALSFGILDFLLTNFSGINVDEHIYRYSIDENPGKLYLLIRARSFFAEPGFFSAYIVLVTGVIAYYDQIFSTNSRYIYILSAFGLSVALSNVGFLLAAIAIVVWLIKEKRIYFALALLAVSLIFSQNVNDEFIYYFDTLISKYTLADEYSAADRLGRYDDSFEFARQMNLLDLVLGASPGAYVEKHGTGPINFYILAFIDYGVIALLLIFIYFYFLAIKYAYPASLVVLLLATNLVFIQDYYLIYMYACIALLQFGNMLKRQLNSKPKSIPQSKSIFAYSPGRNEDGNQEAGKG